MSKKVSTILAANETTAAPAAVDFVVDGDVAKISLQVFTITGTTPTITLSVTELIEGGFTLAYDAQTVNFTVGRTVRGLWSNATGLVMDDTDGGADGVLELKKVAGNFIDNEPLEEVGFATPGKAVVDGVLTRVLVESGDEWAVITSVAVATEAEFINPNRAAAEAGRYDVYPRRFRLTTTEVGTWTAADFAVDLIQSGV